MKKMNLAILGAGNIAGMMAETAARMEEVELYAVAARDKRRAEEFARRYGVKKAYGSYEEMLKEEGIDLVYIATPHSHHMQHAKMCIANQKPVLCEKAFTRTAAEAEELIAYAKRENVFLTEAMWVRYMPMTQTLRKLLDDKVIGEVTGLTGNLGYSLMHIERMIRPELAGGALLDLGVYTLNFAATVLGDQYESIHSVMAAHDTGVDKQEFINLVYPGGKLAGLYATMESTTDRKGYIYGTRGHIVADNINNYECFHIFNNSYEEIERIERPEQITGYEYELLACKKALEEGRLECEEMPHEHTLAMMKLMDAVREQWNQ